MKKVLVLMLVLVFALSFVACGSKEAPAEESAPVEEAAPAEDAEAPAEEAKDIKIAGIVFQDDQFMNQLTQGYIDAGADLGIEVMTANTQNDIAKESELVNTYVTQGVDGIAIAPLSVEASVAALRDANAQGVEIAITNLDIGQDFIAGGYTSDDYTNTKAVGDVAAAITKEKLGDKPLKVAIVQFASQIPEVSAARIEGYLAGFDELGLEYEVVADQDAWTQDMGVEVVGSILTANADLDIIIAANDGGTIGSTQAVVNAGRSADVLVFGHDCSDQISSMILDEEGPLQAVVAQDPYMMGYQAVEALVAALNGEAESRGTTNIVPGAVVSKADMDGVLAWRAAQGLE